MPIVSLPLTYQIANGQTADASQVMANFNQIANNVNANSAQLNTAVTFTAITANGALTFTGALANNLSAGTFKITNLGAPTTAGDALSWGAAANTANLTTNGNVVMNAPASGITLSMAAVPGQNLIDSTVNFNGAQNFLVGRNSNASGQAQIQLSGNGIAKSFRVGSTGSFEIVNNAYSAVIFSLTDTGTLKVYADNGVSGLVEVGFRDVIYTIQNSNYTFQLSDRGKLITSSTASLTYTLPSGVFPAGSVISVLNQSATNYTIAQGAGTQIILAGTGTSGNRTLANNGIATIYCNGANVFWISGPGVT